GSLSAAGRRFGLTPSSVSRHIAGLEAALRVQLLNRNSRSLAVTEAGRIYFVQLEPILQALRDAEASATALQAAPRGTLRIHSRTMFGLRVLTPNLPRFQAEHPGLRVELYLSDQPVHLGDEGFDVVLRIGPPQELNLMQRCVLASERILVASPDYQVRMPPLRRPHDLLLHRCLAYRTGPE